MEKRRKLNVELIKFLIGSMLVVGGLMLLGSSLVNNRQYRKLYNDKALEIARKNAENNGADVEFVKSDCFSALQGRKYDMIVSNPPYISDEEMQTLMPEVRQEPELALFGGGDGLDFYRRISREAPEHLNEGGFLLFEIGWLQKDAVSALMRTFIGEPFALRDYGRNWRVVGAQLKRR